MQKWTTKPKHGWQLGLWGALGMCCLILEIHPPPRTNSHSNFAWQHNPLSIRHKGCRSLLHGIRKPIPCQRSWPGDPGPEAEAWAACKADVGGSGACAGATHTGRGGWRRDRQSGCGGRSRAGLRRCGAGGRVAGNPEGLTARPLRQRGGQQMAHRSHPGVCGRGPGRGEGLTARMKGDGTPAAEVVGTCAAGHTGVGREMDQSVCRDMRQGQVSRMAVPTR